MKRRRIFLVLLVCFLGIYGCKEAVEGEGEPLVEGEGEFLVEGEGEFLVEGEGEPLVEGEGEFPVEGEGELELSPLIEIIEWPLYGDNSEIFILGKVENIDFSQCGVVVYINGQDTVWYPKDAAGAIALIDENGFWEMKIVTHPNDIFAIGILAVLVPKGANLPSCWPDLCLSRPLIDQELASDLVLREPILPKLNFAGYKWQKNMVGPGQAAFSNSSDNVWVDDFGLHLTISYCPEDGQYYSTEVESVESFGYGIYYFQTYGRIDLLDPNAVFGLFTWDREAVDFSHREIDIEFTRWQDSKDPTNAQFVVHPCSECPSCDSCSRFAVDLNSVSDEKPCMTMNHYIIWEKGQIEFLSYSNNNEKLFYSWQYTGSKVPVPGKEKVFLNLWLTAERPMYGLEQEVIITDFFFQPLD